MKFMETALPGAFVIDIEPVEDERGFFARTYCQEEFKARGLNPNLVQCNISHNGRKGTLRGMHYQSKPYEEAKVVWCAAGAIFDVIVDLRTTSPTFKRWHGLELKAGTYRMLYIPEGFAHGFQTLEENSVVYYQMSNFYDPTCARGVRWNDSAFEIKWPSPPSVISGRDRDYPNFIE